MQKLILPINLFPSLNKIIDLSKTHWSRYSNLKAKLTLIVTSYMKDMRPVTKYPVKLKFLWILENKRRDPDNISAVGTKVILDGLVSAQVLKNDGFNAISEINHKFEVDKRHPRVEVTLSY